MLGSNSTHANFSVDDLAVAKSFYVDKLGFSVKRESDFDMLLESGAGTRINVYLKEDHVAWASTVLGIEVDDVKASVDQLVSAGVEAAKIEGADDDGIMSDPEQGDVAWFKDPAGNWICISNRP